jgi:tetratricopeptide (TPR) repeat protein
MMKKFTLITFLLVFLIGNNLFPQARIENKLKFVEAETYVLFEEYEEALAKYLELIKSYPNNSNIKYRIGQCYIFKQGEKYKAIAYLEDAVKNINPKYKEGKFSEKGAPYDALYYLANAYRINNQLDKAIETYELFRKNLDPKVYDTAVVNLQIESCRNAQELMSKPLYIRKTNLGNLINDQYPDMNPVVSGDQNSMVYNRKSPFQLQILYTKKVNNQWIEPINIIPDLGFGQEEGNFATSLSSDGKELYIYRRGDDYDGNIYVTNKINDERWSNIVKLNDNINTKYWESHATVSHDGKKLYFTSNRKGTIGGLDIFVSERDTGNAWGPAKNLGPVINTIYNEDTPFLSADDKTLFFSSSGHFNMGGYDVFYSTLLDNGEWSVPLNVGFPLNTTDDDLFFDPINDGYQAYYAFIDTGGYGLSDVYRIEIFNKDHPRKFIIKGLVKVANQIFNLNDSVKVTATNIANPSQKIVTYSNPKTGEYEIELPQGDYEITYESPYSETVKKNLNLDISNSSDTFVLPGTILPKTDFVADLNVESNKNISVTKGDTIAFPLKVEPGSLLTVEHWVGDSLISTEQFVISDSTFIYKMVPLPGDNKVTFKLTDRFSNITSTDVFITRKQGVTSQPVVRPEYTRVIAQKQVVAFAEMLRNRADDRLKNFININEIQKHQFGKVDDVISFIKDNAAKSSISPEEIDKLALKVAVMDNVLTQAAVDIMAKYSDGEIKKILGDIDIYKLNLKKWTGLQEYISSLTNGEITPETLNKLAGDILMGTDPKIDLLREKLLAYSQNSESGTFIQQSVRSTDEKRIKKAGDWLQTFYNESINQGLTDEQLAKIFAAISTTPGTNIDNFTKDLADNSEEPMRSWVNSLNLRKEGIKTPSDLVLYLIRNKKKGNVTDETLFNSLVNLICAKDITADAIKSNMVEVKGKKMWYLWLLLGAGLLIFIFFYKRKRDKDKKKN